MVVLVVVLTMLTGIAPRIRHVPRVVDPELATRSNLCPHWAEGTPLAAAGILGTLRYTGGRSGRFEIAGVHACVEDGAGTVWWIRVAPGDLWP